MVTVIKANGERQVFDEQKVIRSIQRAGIPLGLQEKVLNHVKEKLHENIRTGEIYHHITEFLEKSDVPYTRSRYSLKESIMMLGPSGYPFEDYIAKILDHHGYTTQVRQVLQGNCVTHEVDVVAEKEGKRSMVEVKFHNNPGTRTEIHVSLYTKSRFEDVARKQRFEDAWIVTNTKVTSDAITFAECSGMKIISWSYPEGDSLRDMIEESKLHPITSLTTLSLTNKQYLLQEHTVTCLDIAQNPSVLEILPLSKDERQKALDEVMFLSGPTDKIGEIK
jgi:Holliday junction resolvase-like predicted endonuclease